MPKRSRKYEVKPNRLNNTADQIERTMEISDVDLALADKVYPGKGRAARMRGLFVDFLAALRPHGSPSKGNRSVTSYFRGDTLVALFEVRNYLISVNRIRNSDSMSRVMAVAIEELAGIVRPRVTKPETELETELETEAEIETAEDFTEETIEITEAPTNAVSVGERDVAGSDRELLT